MLTRLLFGLLLACLVAGCSSTESDPESREFFYGAWKNPKERDKTFDRKLPAN